MSNDTPDHIKSTGVSPVVSTPEEEKSEGLRDLVLAVVFCLVAVVLVRSFLIEPFKIPSSSMVPTLKIGDHIFVTKFKYGLFFPFTKTEMVKTGSPKRGEVVVFLFPKDESLHYIKRVIGLPGDKVEFRGKDLLINGRLVPKERVTDPNEVARVIGSSDGAGELYRENLDGVVHYVRYQGGASADFRRSSDLIEVPPDRFFMAGDNRDDSYDSRSWGTVPRENLKGRAEMVWLSLASENGASQKVRWDRIFSFIH